MGDQCTYLLAYCGVDYELKEYKCSMEDGKTNLGGWKEDKYNLGIGFPNLPYFLDGDIKVAETMPLMRYICNKHKPELLGDSLKERTELDILSAVIHDLKLQTLTYPFYTHGDREKIDKESKAKLKNIVAWLGDKQYLMGDKLCYVDFILLEICAVVDFVTEGRVWTDYPTLKPYSERIRAIPEIQAAIAAAEGKPFNNIMAKLNNK